MNHGELIRKIRLSKGFSQKAVYADIISKSYAIEFEKGKHSITAPLLIEILDRLSMDIDEFLFIYRNYQLTEQSAYVVNYSKFANSHNTAELEKMLNELLKKSGTINHVRAAEIRTRIRLIKHLKTYDHYDSSVILPEDRQTVIDYLTSLQSWTLQEIQLFANTLEYIEPELQLIFFRTISKSLKHYESYDRGRDIYCGLLLNLIHETIKTEQLSYTALLLDQLEVFSTEYKEIYYRITAKFFRGLLKIKQGILEDGQRQAQLAVSILYEVDQPFLAKELEVFLNEQLE